jgi:hypothetical protein
MTTPKTKTGILATTRALFDGYQYQWHGRKASVSEPRKDIMDATTAAAAATTFNTSVNGSSNDDDNDNDKKARSLKSHASKKPPTDDDSTDEPRNESMDNAAATTKLHASTRASSKKSGENMQMQMQSKMTVGNDSKPRSSNKQKKKIRNSKKPPKDDSSDQQQQQQQQQQVKKNPANLPRAVSNKLKRLPPRRPTRPLTTPTVGNSMPLPMTRPKKKNPPEKRKSLVAAHACSHCHSIVGSCSLYKCKCCASTDPDDDDDPGLILCKACCKSRFYGRCQECKSYLCHRCFFVGWEDQRAEEGQLLCDGCALAMGGEAFWKIIE